MKKAKIGLLGMLLLALFCLLPAGEVQAATAKRLFTIVVNDGFVSQSVPVYQFTESNGTTYVAVKKSLSTLPVYAGATSAKISITKKTSLYKSTYKSVSYKKNPSLTATTSLNFILKTTDGTRKTAVLKLSRPGMPKISSLTVSPNSTTGFTPGSGSLTTRVTVKSSVAVKAVYKIKNSSGKVVYKKTLGTKKNVRYTAKWSGKPSKGNAAGLSTSDYVPAGNYKLTVTLQYTVGGKSKYISKTTTVKVNSDSSSTNTGTAQQTWSWKMILSGDDTLDYLAEQVCQDVLTDNMTVIARAKALFDWCARNLSYSKAGINDTATKAAVSNIGASAAAKAYAKELDTLIAQGKATVKWSDCYFGSTTGSGMYNTKMGWTKRGLYLKRGDCLIMSCIYQTLLRHAGIEANIVENDSSKAQHHFWNVVKIGSGYYYCDVNKGMYDGDANKRTFFLRGTSFSDVQWEAVLTTKKFASLVKKVSTADCPGR